MTELITFWLSGLTTGISLSGALYSWSHRRRRRPRPLAPGPWDPQVIYLIYLEPPSTTPHHTLNRD